LQVKHLLDGHKINSKLLTNYQRFSKLNMLSHECIVSCLPFLFWAVYFTFHFPINMPLRASTGPVLVRCCQHRPSTGPVPARNGMFTGLVMLLTLYTLCFSNKLYTFPNTDLRIRKYLCYTHTPSAAYYIAWHNHHLKVTLIAD